MDQDDSEGAAELRNQSVGGWGLLQIAGCTGLTAYIVWAGILMPGFRRVPLRLQVPYIPASRKQVQNVMTLLEGRSGKVVDLGSGDGRIVLEASKRGFRPAIGYELNPWLVRLSKFYAWRAGCQDQVSYMKQDLWKVDLSDCSNVTVFLAPSVLSLLEVKLLSELPEDAWIVAGRFPFPNWKPCYTVGDGVDRTWCYSVKRLRQDDVSQIPQEGTAV
ncbi:adenine nucleotide translocase lysine N-methyltransferase [Scyliorhinus canicula]|uniref:adenine nucleotide translocase lysine N-methyltransferase n=1 Tax=Scyliorhinus canicula TaxID=7830 RepID=UPI0018F69D2C|nr:adenine nucleotide translocase lysine N-methyltransferase [Scyliorhinus canicula]XP_038676337.1 adenine nucleotide translocase lysine N-methyltransferase [Scyliorhinus canicula]XP_038676338.1 adenine nucleotide translocase lysine N-methyltransferase [Scyliorhinus canicula]